MSDLKKPLPQNSSESESPIESEEQYDSYYTMGNKQIQRVLKSPNMQNLTPQVIQTLQRQHGNYFVNQLLQRAQTPTTQKIQRAELEIPQAVRKQYTNYLKTSSLARVNLVPLEEASSKYTADQIWVRDVKMSDDRPPTKYGKEGQRSHTVAWTLTRAALENMGNQKLSDFLKILQTMRDKLSAPKIINKPEATKAFNKLATVIDTGRQKIDDKKDIGLWQQYSTAFLSRYVHLYQLAETTTRRAGAATGHNEAGNMDILRNLELKASDEGLSEEDKQDAKNATIALLDIQEGLGVDKNKPIYEHWYNNLYLAFPQLMSKYETEIIPVNIRGKITLEDEIKNKKDNSFSSDNEKPNFAIPKENRATFTANIAVKPSDMIDIDESIDIKNDYKSGETEIENTVKVSRYKLNNIIIDDVQISDDRPNTRYGNLQRSHTVAWTFIRRHLLNFNGGSAQDLYTFIKKELAILKNDIGTNNSKIKFDAKGFATNIETQVGNTETHMLPIHEWQSALSELVETYITLYQLSNSATYAKEERPAGHGESSAMKTLAEYKPEAKDPEQRTIAITNAAKLIDAAIGQGTLSPESWQKAVNHWIELLKGMFPDMMKQDNFEEDLKAKVQFIEVTEERIQSLTDYRKNLPLKQKILLEIHAQLTDTKTQEAIYMAKLESRIPESLKNILIDESGDNEATIEQLVSFFRLPTQTINLIPRKSGRNEGNEISYDEKKRKMPFKEKQQTVKKQKHEEGSSQPIIDLIKKLKEDIDDIKEKPEYFTKVEEKKKIIADEFFKFYTKIQRSPYDFSISQKYMMENKDTIIELFEQVIDAIVDDSKNGQGNLMRWFDIIKDSDDEVNYKSVSEAIAKKTLNN